MKKFFVCSIVAISMMAGIGVPSVALATSNVEINEVEQNKEKEKVTNEFLAMQDQITSVLTIENGHYVYDKETVKNIVNGFDFDELNEKTGISYTTETFYNEAISNIDSTEIVNKRMKRNANRYNRNDYESGWNYGRAWMDTKKTNEEIDRLNSASQAINLGTMPIIALEAAGLGPIGTVIAAGIGIGIVYDTWYFSNVATNLGKKNNGTGTVLEINRFTTQYSCWSQDEYKK
ncbi:hypothetical protein [Enterococcus faecalis]|uniref:hypothetical protein n=1 Tax=Enterococcus faecalis TaxID=1351 RepID=UPI001927436C